MTPALTTQRPAAHHALARTTLALGAAALIAGCAQVPNPSTEDPWESLNRGTYAFNDKVDRVFMKPIATGYETIVPNPVRTCIHNVFSNLGDGWSAANSMLQGRGRDFVDTFGRILLNSTVGLGGCIDVASMRGAHKIPNDFGMTLGVWGLGQGPYLVWPFLGPNTVRDSLGTIAMLTAPVGQTSALFAIDNVPVRNTILGLYIIDVRASLLEADRLVDQIALDKYSFIRDAYLQRRQAMLNSRQQGPSATTTDPLHQSTAQDNHDLPVYDDPNDE